jgi:hypothetical protein
VSLPESLVIIGLWIIPKIQKTPAECGLNSELLAAAILYLITTDKCLD